MADEYKYDVSKCDVASERRDQLQAFRDKRRQWLSWVDNDEHHAISLAVSSMAWSDVSIRTLSQIAITDENSALHNTLVADGLINGYIATQVLAVRRLMDKSKGVISLRKLIVDMRSNIKLFTRENYVCFDGLPYDYAAVENILAERHRDGGAFWADREGPEASDASRMAHEWFDRLTGIGPQNRNRKDCLPFSKLKVIESWLDNSVADELAKWSHEFLAHAGSETGRTEFLDRRPTFDKISEAIKILAQATEALSSWFLYSGACNRL